MLKAAHIHSDLKFINCTKRFEGQYFDNIVIIICNNGYNINGNYKNTVVIYENDKQKMTKILDICQKVDLVVLYDLSDIKYRIAVKLPSNVKVAWRFFGHELYQKRNDLYLSNLTKKTRNRNWLGKFNKNIEDMKDFLIYLIKNYSTHNSLYNNAIKRIDFFLGISEEEYNYLKSLWPDLPKFIKLPFSDDLKNNIEPFIEKKNIVLVGNSRSPYNNVLDIISIIESCKKKHCYKFVFPFSYGNESHYSKKVRDEIKNKKYYKILENFYPLDEYNKIYQNAISAVFNGYRQMALGNIFLALKSGVKIYLNKKNSILKWLKSEGFLVYNIENFIHDLKHDNLRLNYEQAKLNMTQFNYIKKTYSYEDFQRKIFNEIKRIS
jgi:dTDP-N-acetylfucosamine:lipid II N-acetylfucosaminyltransferase